MHRLLSVVCVLGGVSVASGQMWCSPAGGGMRLPSGPGGGYAAPRTSFIPFNRGNNFLGTAAELPRPIGSTGLLLEGAINITPGYSSGWYPNNSPRGTTRSPVGTGRQFFEGSSLSINGNVSSGDVRLALRLGSNPAGLTGSFEQPLGPSMPAEWCPNPPLPPEHCPPWKPVWPPNGFVIPWWWGWNSPRYPIDGPVVIYSNMVEPVEEVVVEEEVPLTEHQRAALLLRDGDVTGAIALLRAHVAADSADAEAMRLLAIALLLDQQMCEAAALMSFAYEYDRTMVDRPLGGGNLPRGDRQLRDALRKAVTYANAQETPSAWLLVTVLMQAEGRDFTASAMLRKAEKAGLNEPVRRAFEAALAG